MELTSPVSPLDRWGLDPAIVHLNHGSFGGCPRAALDAAAGFRARLEAAPMRFMVVDWQRELDTARAVLAAFVGAAPERLVFVPSATTAVAIALASAVAELAPGDEVLTTSHTYRACANQLARHAAERGLRITVVPVSLPFDADALVAAIAAAVTPRTRLALLDHITSPSALRLPLERLLPLLAAREVAVIVDGAHAPGQVELALDALGATYYAGNCHKWMCAPKSAGFLVVSPEVAARNAVRPVVTSHGASPEYGGDN